MFGEVREPPQTEETPFYPRSPYGVSKVFAHYIPVNCRESYDLFAVSGGRLCGRDRVAGTAVDTVTREPYHRELVNVDVCLITSRMGSMSVDCRVRMEYGASRNAVAFLRGEPLDERVPESEYAMRASEKGPVAS